MERRLLWVGIVLCCTVATQPVAFAQPCDRALPLIYLQAAPCRGILVPTAQANSALQCVKVELPKCREEKASAVALLRVDKEALTTLLKAERARTASLLGRVDLRPPDDWWGEAVAFTLGVVVSAAAVYTWAQVDAK